MVNVIEKKKDIKCLSPFRENVTDSRQMHVNKSSSNVLMNDT